MSKEYSSLKIKKDSMNKLKKAAELLNKKGQYKKITVAGLVSQLAESYAAQMDGVTLQGNNEDWIVDGVPMILNSHASKHFRELKHYEPLTCVSMVTNFIVNEAMNRRISLMTKGRNNE